MSTTAEKLWEATQTLPEPLLAEVLDFAEFLLIKRGGVDGAKPSTSLIDLCGGLENSASFRACNSVTRMASY